jgi:hypothetical protein
LPAVPTEAVVTDSTTAVSNAPNVPARRVDFIECAFQVE